LPKARGELAKKNVADAHQYIKCFMKIEDLAVSAIPSRNKSKKYQKHFINAVAAVMAFAMR
jgi:7,8-dihydro-6-hydroxymethylpterin-pyrophosphokinase